MTRHVKCMGCCHALTVLLAISLSAAAPSREVAAQAAAAAAPPHAVMQRLVRVPQPLAISMVVGDAHRVLVAGLGSTAKDAIVVYKLRADGTLTADPPQLLNIPRPDALAAAVIQPVAMVLHPALPLLYVWVDIAGFADSTPEYKLATDQLNHLVIYKIANGALEQVAAVAAGASFRAGQRFSPIGIAPDGTRLFVSNTTDGNGGVGYFDLDAEGAVVPIAIPVKGSLDGYGLEEFQMETRPRTISVREFRDYPTAVGMACFSHDFACFTTGGSLTVWDTTNRLAPLGVTSMRQAAAHMFLAAHPTRSVLYTVPQNADGVAQRMAHAQGFPSQLPAAVATPVATAGPVVVGGDQPAMVSASATKLLVFPLKANGDFDGSCLQYDLPAERMQALAVSQKAERVYAPVKAEVKPE